MILNESFYTIADGDNVSVLDEFGRISLEEGFCGSCLISEDAIDHGYFKSFFGVDDSMVGGENFGVDVISTSMSLELFDFDEGRFCFRFVFCHTC